MFRIKICGVTNAEDARLAAASGADAIGLNFYAQSSRFIDDDAAQEISAAASGTMRVGVFVNASDDCIAGAIDRARLDWIQLHGDEPPESVARAPSHVRVMRAFRLRDDGLAPVAQWLEAARAAGRRPDAVLLDSFVADAYGGSGHTADWKRIAEERGLLGEIPIVLAGGLTAGNVGDAIRAVRPDAVDTASGVESSPRRKDPQRMEQFVTAAKRAYNELV